MYRTQGSVRGRCGHNHRTLSGAVRCLKQDRKGCAVAGGYSDRDIVRIDGVELTEGEYYAIDEFFDREGEFES